MPERRLKAKTALEADNGQGNWMGHALLLRRRKGVRAARSGARENGVRQPALRGSRHVLRRNLCRNMRRHIRRCASRNANPDENPGENRGENRGAPPGEAHGTSFDESPVAAIRAIHQRSMWKGRESFTAKDTNMARTKANQCPVHDHVQSKQMPQTGESRQGTEAEASADIEEGCRMVCVQKSRNVHGKSLETTARGCYSYASGGDKPCWEETSRTFDRRTGELAGSLSGSARFTSKRTALPVLVGQPADRGRTVYSHGLTSGGKRLPNLSSPCRRSPRVTDSDPR